MADDSDKNRDDDDVSELEEEERDDDDAGEDDDVSELEEEERDDDDAGEDDDVDDDDDGDDADDDDADADDDDADADDDDADDDDADDDDADADDDDADADDAAVDDDDDAEDADDDAAVDDDGDAAAARPRASDDDDDEDRAADVAAALGVGESADEDEAGEDEEKPQKVNRAERRRQRALGRRKGKGDTEGEPKDRNKARREALLKRRRRAAQAEDEGEEAAPDRLLPSEMVDDALARSGAAAVRWIQNNWKVLQWVITAGIVGGGVALGYVYFSSKTSEEASDTLAAALVAEDATVIPPDKDERDEDQKKGDIRTIFPSEEERETKALESYRQVASEHAGTGAAILAKLGEGGVLLDKREWDPAIAAFDEVLASQLASVDNDVKLRALEGKGFAQEAKKDLDGALATFEKIHEIPGEVNKVLSLYHQGRVYAAKGQTDQAKTKLTEARKLAEKAKLDTKLVAAAHPYRWLERAIVDELTAVDPSTAPLVKPGGQLPPEKLQELLKQQGFPGGLPGGAP